MRTHTKRDVIRVAIVGVVGLLLLAAVPAQGALVAYYPFDADNADDLSGNANDGTVGGSITFQTDTPLASGKSARSYTGGGAGNVVTVPTSASLESINDTLSIAFWMKSTLSDNNNWVRIFQHGSEANPSQTWLVDRYSNSNRANVRVDTMGAGGQFNQNIATGGPAVFDGTWHHLAFTLDSGVWAKYVDGVPVESGGYNHGQGLSNTRPLYMFGRNGTGEYVGFLDEVAVFDEKLVLNQVEYLHGGGDPRNLPLPPPPPPPSFNARMIQISPGGGSTDNDINTANEAIVIATEATGLGTLNASNGANYNVTTFVEGQYEVIDFAGGGGSFSVNNPYPDGRTTPGDDFLVGVQAYLEMRPGTYTIAFGSDDGGALQLSGITFTSTFNENPTGGQGVGTDTILFNGNRGHGWTGGTFTVPGGGGVYYSELYSLFYERGGGDSYEIALAQGSQGSFNGNFELLTDGLYGWRVAPHMIPEPSTLLIWSLLAGLGIGLGWRRRKK